jgi:lactam utilization protein B
LDGKKIYLPAKSICIHGDKEEALNQAKEIKKGLIKNNFDLVNLNQI